MSIGISWPHWFRVGSAAKPANTTDGDLTAKRAVVGTDGALPTGVDLWVPSNAARFSGSVVGLVAAAGIDRVDIGVDISPRIYFENVGSHIVGVDSSTGNFRVYDATAATVRLLIDVAAAQTAGHYLRSNGTNYADSAIQDSDVAAGAWNTSFTPVITAGTGTFTSVAGTVRYRKVGNIVFFQETIVITTNGTAAGYILSTLPFNNAAPAVIPGRCTAVSGSMVQGLIAGNVLSILTYNNGYPGASGETIVISGVYEAA